MLLWSTFGGGVTVSNLCLVWRVLDERRTRACQQVNASRSQQLLLLLLLPLSLRYLFHFRFLVASSCVCPTVLIVSRTYFAAVRELGYSPHYSEHFMRQTFYKVRSGWEPSATPLEIEHCGLWCTTALHPSGVAKSSTSLNWLG